METVRTDSGGERSATAAPFRERRLQLGLTQEDLAREIGCSLNYVRLVEHGYRPAVASSPVLRALARRLGISLDEEPLDDVAPAGSGRDVKGERGSARRISA